MGDWWWMWVWWRKNGGECGGECDDECAVEGRELRARVCNSVGGWCRIVELWGIIWGVVERGCAAGGEGVGRGRREGGEVQVGGEGVGESGEKVC